MPNAYEEEVGAQLSREDQAAEDEWLATMAEQANIQTAREGIIDPEQLSVREQRLGEEAVAAEVTQREEETAALRQQEAIARGESPVGSAAAYGADVARGLAGEVDTGAPTPAAGPAKSPRDLFKEAMAKAMGLFGRTKARRVETAAKPILEREKAETLEAAGREELAELSLAETEAQGMQRVADIEQATHDRLKDMRVDEAASEYDRQQYMGQERDKLDGAIERFRTGEVRDPWADRSVAERVDDGIAIALGAVGAALLGGENVALSVINKAMDAQMESDRANMNIAGSAVGMQENLLQESMALAGDARIAEMHAKESYLEAVKHKLRKEALATGSQQAMNNAEKTIAQLDQQIAALRSKQDLRIQQLGYAKVGGGYAVPKELRKLGADIIEAGVKGEIATEGKISVEQAKQMGEGERGGMKPKQFAEEQRMYAKAIEPSVVAQKELVRFRNQYDLAIPGVKTSRYDPTTAFSQMFEDPRIARGAINRIALAYRKAVTGVAGGEKEMEDIRKSLLGSETAGEIEAGFASLEAKLRDSREVFDKGTNEAIKRAYQEGTVSTDIPRSGASFQEQYAGEK